MFKIDIQFVRDRIAFLRTDRNISARELSLRIGQSTGYISQIETGKSNPSLEMLFCICEELDISMSDFFDDSTKHPILLEKLILEAKSLSKPAMECIVSVAKNLKK